MKRFVALIDGRERTIEFTPLNEGRFQVAFDGQMHVVEVRSFSADSLSVLVDRRSCDIVYAFQSGRLELHFRHHDFELEILDERKLRTRRLRAQWEQSGPEAVKSAMPGKIVRVHVKAGDRIAPRSPLLIIEAMKMENEIFSRKGGIVRAVHIAPGQAVESDALLVEIAPCD
ncbi:MAG: acetyl-CoA carboxylase biotin carboxyl carrier protein subunit [Candidatus Aminicenantes bacterium]|nr:acetyl-CoA carboxylase biotin carboxyl carrier protein subunit [Candidatus Aminicenantes bacterium]